MTSRGFNAGWLVGAVLLSSWAVSSASDQAPERRAMGSQAGPMPLPPIAVDVDEQISKLSAWTATQAVPASRRNPFKFEQPPMRVRSRAAVAAPAAVEPVQAAPVAAAVALRLPAVRGVASIDGALTAVVSFEDSLHYVKRGDVIAGRFRVDSVSADAVDVFDLTLGTNLRLTLQSLT